MLLCRARLYSNAAMHVPLTMSSGLDAAVVRFVRQACLCKILRIHRRPVRPIMHHFIGPPSLAWAGGLTNEQSQTGCPLVESSAGMVTSNGQTCEDCNVMRELLLPSQEVQAILHQEQILLQA